jgi:phage terminase large subunit-like protein
MLSANSLPSLEEIRAEKAKREAAKGSNWRSIARDEQVRPEGCNVFTLVGGRGSGKTRAGAEDFLERVRAGVQRLHILAPTFADGRDVCVEGDSGLIACALPGEIANWNRSMGELFFRSGAKAKIFAACEPDRLNGPQCGHLWADEFGLYGDTAAIDMALFGLRLGDRVTSCWTSTPKMTPATRYVIQYTIDTGGVRRRMRTRDNVANLAAGVVDALERKYGGTRLGRAELEGEEIEEVEGALWNPEWFRRQGFRKPPAIFKRDGEIVCEIPAALRKIVVGVDPSVSDPEKRKNPHKEPDACGLIVAGVDDVGWGHVLYDATAVMKPEEWAKLSLRLYTRFKANEIVYESNQGGELVAETIKAYGTCAIRGVHASAGKRVRAEPVAALYEQGRVSHYGEMRDLEDQQCTWDASDPSLRSPNNIDALVVSFHGLGLCDMTGMRVRSFLKTQ